MKVNAELFLFITFRFLKLNDTTSCIFYALNRTLLSWDEGIFKMSQLSIFSRPKTCSLRFRVHAVCQTCMKLQVPNLLAGRTSF